MTLGQRLLQPAVWVAALAVLIAACGTTDSTPPLGDVATAASQSAASAIVSPDAPESAAPTAPASPAPRASLAPTETPSRVAAPTPALQVPPRLPTAVPRPTAPPTPTPTPSPLPAPALVSPLSAPATTSAADPANQESGEDLVSRLGQEAWDRLVVLTEEYSPRSSATEQEKAAAKYLLREFQAMGYRAELQLFDLEVWSPETPAVTLNSPEERTVQGFPLSMSGRGQATGVFADVGMAFEDEVPAQDIRGKIALIQRGTITFQEKVSRVAEAGAVAAIIYNNEPGGFGGALSSRAGIPAVSITRESGQEIKRLMANGEVEGTVAVIYTKGSLNVVAEKPGAADDGKLIVLGGHLDTVPRVPGSNDNGSGIATLLTVAQQLSDRTYPFTLRFVAFGSEELGLFGSKHYVSTLTPEERESVIAMLNFDALGTGEVAGILGDSGLLGKLADYGKEKGIEVKVHASLAAGTGSDHSSFTEVGIPAVFFLGDDYSRIHTPQDTLEFVRSDLMGASAALAVGLLDILSGG